MNTDTIRPLGAMLLSVLLILSAPAVRAVDVGECECVDESEFFPSSATEHQGTAVDDVSIDSCPTEVCVGAWFKVVAGGGGDCDLVKGMGSHCKTSTDGCEGSAKPACAEPGDVYAHNDKNVDKKYIWTVTGHLGNVHLPPADEEIDDTRCPAFNYDTDPFVWLQAPLTPGSISISVSRDGNGAYPYDGTPAAATAQVSVVDNRAVRQRAFFCTLSGQESTVDGHITYANDSCLIDDDDGGYRQYDSNNDKKLADPDLYRGGYDTSICVKYDKTSYDTPLTVNPNPFVSDWAYETVAWIGGGTHTVAPSDFVVNEEGQSDPTDWADFEGQSTYHVLYVRWCLQVSNSAATPPVVYDRGGGGACRDNRAVVGLQNYVQGTLLHEWGHNTGTSGSSFGGLEHVLLSNNTEPYVKSVMGNTTTSRKWLSLVGLTTDTKRYCGGGATQAQAWGFLIED